MKLSIFLANTFLKYNMSIEMVLVGLILFSGMAAGGVKIWLNKRKEKETDMLDSNILPLITYSLKLSDIQVNV